MTRDIAPKCLQECHDTVRMAWWRLVEAPVRDWRSGRPLGPKSDKTLHGYAQDIDDVCRWCRKRKYPFEAMLRDAHQIEEFWSDSVSYGKAPRTIRRCMTALQLLAENLDPPAELALYHRLRRRTPKTATRVVKFLETRELVRLGKAEMKRAQHIDPPDFAAAVQFRRGMVAALNAPIGLRSDAFTAMETERERSAGPQKNVTLVKDGDGYVVLGPRHQSGRKSGPAKRIPRRRRVPAHLKPWIDRYLSTYRPILQGEHDASPALWLAIDGSPLSKSQMYRDIVQVTGHPPHSFRTSYASSVLARDPSLAASVSRDLGHSPQVMYDHYLKVSPADTIALTRACNSLVDEILRSKEMPDGSTDEDNAKRG